MTLLLLLNAAAAFNLEYYTEVHDLSYLLATLGRGPFSARYRKLSQGLCELVEGYGLVGFTPLAIQVGQGGVFLADCYPLNPCLAPAFEMHADHHIIISPIQGIASGEAWRGI
jgi:hypothetical protein